MAPAHTAQVIELLGSLSAIPGSAEIQLRARRFTRALPSQPIQVYQEFLKCFESGEPPEPINIPYDPDEITVSVQGSLPDGIAAVPLLSQIEDFVQERLGAEWEMRAELPPSAPHHASFRFEVFMERAAHGTSREPAD